MESVMSLKAQGFQGRTAKFIHYTPSSTGYTTNIGGQESSLPSDQILSAAGQQPTPPPSETQPTVISDLRHQLGAAGVNSNYEKSFTDSHGLNKPSDIADNGSQTTNGTPRGPGSETSHGTPNDSMTSTSLMSACSQHKSSSSPTAAPTPLPTGNNVTDITKFNFTKYRPKSSIPSTLSAAAYGQQCVSAAYACRLNPYALHRKEQNALQDHLCHLHVTMYLNIRNGILRLWTRNPMVSVTREEALGCAKDYRWMNLASFAFDWLVRNGYINFGCVEIPVALVPPKRGRRKDGPVIVVIGAGMAGLGTARQLEGLFHHYRDSSISPRVVLLEGRRRIGGRIYSHPLRSLQTTNLAPGLVPKAEMGAHIIVGFDRGNPLDQIVRGQLALPYHLLRDISTIYDVDGSPVDEVQDAMDERLYNQVLDSSGSYRHKAVILPTAEGDREMIDAGRDSSISDGLTVRQYEEARAAGTIGLLLPAKRVRRRGVGHKTADIKTTQNSMPVIDHPQEQPTALTCQSMGWKLNDGISVNESLNLDPVAKSSNTQTLGAVMDEGFKQYQRMLPLTVKDMQLLNWHLANLEYANAANVGKLSLSGWDQDMGNEFEGEHSQVIGGYQQVPYGLLSFPSPLDIRTNKTVSKISYDSTGSSKHKAVVHCEDGDSFAADKVVFTGSLGVLKQGSIKFEPPLPDWKSGAIERLGFGLLNKVILVFEKPFWDTERDMFGLLREPASRGSMAQEDYSANRGRFYLFWNCLKTTGLPVLIALMAGDAAHQAEHTPDGEIIAEVTSQLRNIFKQEAVPDPLETIVTRWSSDKFTRGSYSYVAAEALPGDYDLMAQPIGNLHFAGEATCGTHPATVHGAYLSGLRAASEIIETIVGPLEIPNPLVPEKGKIPDVDSPSLAGQKRKEPPVSTPTNSVHPPTDPVGLPLQGRVSNNSFPSDTPLREAYNKAMWAAIYGELGLPESKPARIAGLNPFLLYQKDHWSHARTRAEDERLAAKKNPVRAPRDEIRAVLGLMWRQASDDERRPYLDQAEANRQTNSEIWDRWKRDNAEWERKARDAKQRWSAANPYEKWQPEPSKTGDVPASISVPASAPFSMPMEERARPTQQNGNALSTGPDANPATYTNGAEMNTNGLNT